MEQRRRGRLTWTLRDADGAVLILGVGVGLHLKCLLVVNQSLGTLRHTGARVVEAATRLQRGHGWRQRALQRIVALAPPLRGGLN